MLADSSRNSKGFTSPFPCPFTVLSQSKISASSNRRLSCVHALLMKFPEVLTCNFEGHCSTGMVTSIISDMSTTPESLLSVSSTRCLNHWSSTGSEPYHNLPFLSPVPSLEPTGEWYTSSSVICRAPGSRYLHQHRLHRNTCILKRKFSELSLLHGEVHTGCTQSLSLAGLDQRMSIQLLTKEHCIPYANNWAKACSTWPLQAMPSNFHDSVACYNWGLSVGSSKILCTLLTLSSGQNYLANGQKALAQLRHPTRLQSRTPADSPNPQLFASKSQPCLAASLLLCIAQQSVWHYVISFYILFKELKTQGICTFLVLWVLCI